MKILIADDELTIRRSYRTLFESEGYDVITARDGVEALERFFAEKPDLLLLDVMMPKKNGIVVCQEIRRQDAVTPILFFTSMPSDVMLVRGLGLGADDYIEKTRSVDEFVARVGAALRRRRVALDAVRRTHESVSLSGVVVDFEQMTAKGETIDTRLTRTEKVVLQLLSSDRGRVFSMDEIFGALGYTADDSAVRTCVSRLKKKLGRAGELIVNERGMGYRLIP